MSTLIQRMVGVSRFDQRIVEEVEADAGANGQALTVVLLASLGAGVGWIGVGPGRLAPIVMLTSVATMGWVAWACLTYLIGTRWFPEPQTKTDVGELLRTLGFAGSPAVLFALAMVPGARAIVTPVVALITLAAMIVAVRQALDYTSVLRAVSVCLAAWVVVLAVLWVIGVFFSPVVS
jgi:hypothetical protein